MAIPCALRPETYGNTTTAPPTALLYVAAKLLWTSCNLDFVPHFSPSVFSLLAPLLLAASGAKSIFSFSAALRSDVVRLKKFWHLLVIIFQRSYGDTYVYVAGILVVFIVFCAMWILLRLVLLGFNPIGSHFSNL